MIEDGRLIVENRNRLFRKVRSIHLSEIDHRDSWLIFSSCNRFRHMRCLGYKRVGMGAYSYHIFDAPPSDSFQEELAEDCQLIRYDERVFFEYSGGAIGRDTFDPDNKQKFLERHKNQ